jgi:hypothetical protein
LGEVGGAVNIRRNRRRATTPDLSRYFIGARRKLWLLNSMTMQLRELFGNLISTPDSVHD